MKVEEPGHRQLLNLGEGTFSLKGELEISTTLGIKVP